MFLETLGSDDPRFRTLRFHEGLNILLADKSANSDRGDSRNGVGKTSFVRLLRYLVGGSRSKWIKGLGRQSDQVVHAVFNAPAGVVRVERRLSSPGALVDGFEMNSKEWEALAGSKLLGLPRSYPKPTSGELFSQLARLDFSDAVKAESHDTLLDCSMRLGYLLGLSMGALQKGQVAASFKEEHKNLKRALDGGAIGRFGPGEGEAKAELVSCRAERARLAEQLADYEIDERYAAHQERADELSRQIRDLNATALAAERRVRELGEASRGAGDGEAGVDTDRLLRLYSEAGAVFSSGVVRSFADVRAFHESVALNRRLLLSRELESARAELSEAQLRRKAADEERSELLRLLESSRALESVAELQRALSQLDAKIAALEARASDYASLANMKVALKGKEADAASSLRLDMAENGALVDEAVSLFTLLSREIYSDRRAALSVAPDDKGMLRVEPKIEGDDSKGILGAETFLLDIVCVVAGSKAGRIPGFLLHDSQLFDAMDNRQLSSCLSIGARLAEEYGFQYIVTLNTDRLVGEGVEGFDWHPYALDVVLTDKGEDGGLFGFRFE